MRRTAFLGCCLLFWGCGDDAVVAGGGGTTTDSGASTFDGGGADAASISADATASNDMSPAPDATFDSAVDRDSEAPLDAAASVDGAPMPDAITSLDATAALDGGMGLDIGALDAGVQCRADEACGAHQVCTPDGECVCAMGFGGDACDACAEGYLDFPDCRADPCIGIECMDGQLCDQTDGACVDCLADDGCPADRPVCEPAGRVCQACLADADCGDDTPFCDGGRCVACRADQPAPDGLCQGGICGAGGAAACEGGAWRCAVPGFTQRDVCDGWDTDCDGMTDEDCEPPVVDLDRIVDGLEAAMYFFEIGPDGTTYLSAVRGGIGFVKRIPADPEAPVTLLRGNSSHNHGDIEVNPVTGDLVLLANAPDIEPGSGLRVYQDCAPLDPGCGCAGQVNCPGFSYEPWVRSTFHRVYGMFNGSPSGVEVAPDGSYYVSEFIYENCVEEGDAVDCGPDHPETWCTLDQPARCGDAGTGQLAHMRVPADGAPVRWQIVAEFPGREITSMALGRDGDLLLGLYGSGQMPRSQAMYFDPRTQRQIALRGLTYPIGAITNDPHDGSWYAAELLVDSNPRRVGMHRFAADGRYIDLPDAWVAPRNTSSIHMKFGPDGRLYRLTTGGQESFLDALELH